MSSEQRRFPRLRHSAPATLCGRRSQRGVPATITSVTCEGVGVSLQALPEPPLVRGESLTLRFSVLGEALELPSKIVWMAETIGGSEADMGIRFQLDAAPASARRRYASWIVDRLSRGRILVRKSRH